MKPWTRVRIDMADKLLQVENLSVTFKMQGSDIEAVRDISFEINCGETLESSVSQALASQ